ncbi:hypothetical protein K1719_014301 [Acacia pycnantha]|nr:hypothetical protein K1719_014301 [Acacia pycnantha]
MRHCPECVEQVTAKRETVLYLAVKANQLKAAEVIVERIKWLLIFQTLLKAKDINGKTFYDLASAKKQLQILEALEYEVDDDDEEISEELFINMEGEGSESEASKKEYKDISNESQLQEDA